MRWLLLTDELNSISKPCIDQLEVAGQTVLVHAHQGQINVEKIKEQINKEKPDRILLIINAQTSSKLAQNLTHHLLVPFYVVQATTQSYTSLPLLILTVTSDEKNLAIIQNATDQLLTIYPHIFQ